MTEAETRDVLLDRLQALANVLANADEDDIRAAVEALAYVDTEVRAAVLAERERNARIAETVGDEATSDDPWDAGAHWSAHRIAAAIRADPDTREADNGNV